MELKLDSKDITRILLQWAEDNYPLADFNDVEFDSYSYSRGVTLSHVDLPPETPQLEQPTTPGTLAVSGDPVLKAAA